MNSLKQPCNFRELHHTHATQGKQTCLVEQLYVPRGKTWPFQPAADSTWHIPAGSHWMQLQLPWTLRVRLQKKTLIASPLSLLLCASLAAPCNLSSKLAGALQASSVIPKPRSIPRVGLSCAMKCAGSCEGSSMWPVIRYPTKSQKHF